MGVISIHKGGVMSQDEIKSIIKKYKYRASLVLGAFLMFALFSNWYLINNNIECHAELGLPYTNSDSGFVWGTIIMGLIIVLQLCFYSFEQILLKIFSNQEKCSE
jgi:hypothetical protein